MIPPQATMLGRRLHLQHGPIDLVIEAWGDESEVRAAYTQAESAFGSVLQNLVDELPVLRRDVRSANVDGPVAKRMVAATTSHDCFITPMAAVAGSVADHMLSALRKGQQLCKAVVNNGGDIALWLSGDESMTVGVGDMNADGVTLRPVKITSGSGIGGVATSGWRGRSHSLGIADFVTVFARDAATADAAATLIANAVDLPGSDKVERIVATELSPDSDLGERLVTVDVAMLSSAEISQALSAGLETAEKMIERGIILSAVLGLQGERMAAKCRGFPLDLQENYSDPARLLQEMGEPA